MWTFISVLCYFGQQLRNEPLVFSSCYLVSLRYVWSEVFSFGAPLLLLYFDAVELQLLELCFAVLWWSIWFCSIAIEEWALIWFSPLAIAHSLQFNDLFSWWLLICFLDHWPVSFVWVLWYLGFAPSLLSPSLMKQQWRKGPWVFSSCCLFPSEMIWIEDFSSDTPLLLYCEVFKLQLLYISCYLILWSIAIEEWFSPLTTALSWRLLRCYSAWVSSEWCIKGEFLFWWFDIWSWVL